MDHYHIWFDLKDSRRDLEFVAALKAFLGRLANEGRIMGYRLERRKLGFGPEELGEFHLDIEVKDLAQLDQAFGRVAPRVGEVEAEHTRVWAMVTGFRSGLWRDFPDPVREQG
jgi:hypothetical protein